MVQLGGLRQLTLRCSEENSRARTENPQAVRKREMTGFHFGPGDLVRLRILISTNTIPVKLWRLGTGPFRVAKILLEGTYFIRTTSKNGGPPFAAHYNSLKPCGGVIHKNDSDRQVIVRRGTTRCAQCS